MNKKNYLVFLWIFLLYSCGKSREEIQPIISNITEVVYAPAVIKATDQYDVFSTVSGILKEIKVAPGDSVKAGDILFVLDNNMAMLNTENARLALELSQENNRRNSDRIQQAELQIKLALEKYRLDSSLYIRQKALWSQNVGSKLELDQRKLNYTVSRNNYAIAKRALDQLKTQLDNEFERAKVNYNISKTMADDYLIKSSIAGRVFDILKEKGELISPQIPIAVIGKVNHFILEMEVDENDIVKIKLGQPVEITMDSYKNQVFEAFVDKIYPIMDQRSRTFKVQASFNTAPQMLYPNLTAEANIIVRVKKRVITIPRSYLENDKYVWISKTEKREVKTGLKDYKKVEIIQGLDSTQTIYKPQ